MQQMNFLQPDPDIQEMIGVKKKTGNKRKDYFLLAFI